MLRDPARSWPLLALVLRSFGAALSAMAGLLAAAPASAAATRICTPAIVSEATDARSETAARKAALDGWVGEARKLGEAFTAWRLALDKGIACKTSATGIFCVASARPCGISQLPGQAPPGTKVPLQIAPKPAR